MGIIHNSFSLIGTLRNRSSVFYNFAANAVNQTVTLSGLSGYAAAQACVFITINPGVYIYSTNTAIAALTITGGTTGDRVRIVNKGYIMGMGGTGATRLTSPATGGNAICIGLPTTIDNTYTSAYIGGGGGGGATGWFNGAGIYLIGGGGGGAGGGLGGGGYIANGGQAAAGGSGGAIGSTGSNGAGLRPGAGGGAGGGGGGAYYFSCGCSYVYGGGGGGRIFPGTGGSGGGGCGSSSGGSAGGAGNAAGVLNCSSLAPNQVAGGAGGGGWGASGGSAHLTGCQSCRCVVQTQAGATGGKAVSLNGQSITWVNGCTARIYGSVS
jgi:hypothetical protein